MGKLTFVKAGFAGEIQKSRDRGAENIGVQNASLDATARK